MPPLFIRCSLVKRSLNCRWKSTRSLAYTTCSDVSDRSPDANALCHQRGKFKATETLDQWKREQSIALLFVRHLKESGFKHDVETYMAIVGLLCHSGMILKLNILFIYTIEKAPFEISHLLQALIEEKLIKAVEVYASVGRFHEAKETLLEMRNKGGLMVSTETCNFIMNQLMEWGEVEDIWPLFEELKRNGLTPNVDTYGILMRGFCMKGRLGDAWELISLMIELGVEPNAFIYGQYVKGFCYHEKTELAFEVLKNLRESNKPLDVFAYKCVIRAFVKESKLQEAEDVLLHDMKIGKVVPDADCYGALIQGYCKKGDTAKASYICDEMETRTCLKADYVVARSMMQSLVGLDMYAEALDTFKGFIQSGVFLDGDLFNIAIDAACNLGKMEDAMGLLEEMKDRKMKPSKMHYRTLMEGYCDWVKPWNVLKMFQEMMRNGLTPDSTTYHFLSRNWVIFPLNMLFKH